MSIVLDQPKDVSCVACQKQMKDTDSFYGKKMWHGCHHSCGHPHYYICPACWPTTFPSCLVCGCEVLYS
jgi:hypothetical protein